VRLRFLIGATAACLSMLPLAASAQASGGSVVSWGYNVSGETGTGQATTTGCDCLPTPVAIPGLSGVTQVEGGYSHTLYLLSDGTVKSAGDNNEGQLGYSTADPETNPVPTTIPGLSNVIQIAAGGDSSYALLSNGTVMAWGKNVDGELGLPYTGPESCEETCSKQPIAVPGVANAVAIAAGTEGAFALLSDGTVIGWGVDSEGQLGDGIGVHTGCKCIDHTVQIPGVTNAIAISAGEALALTLNSDRSIIAWGDNYYGAMGTGNSDSNLECFCAPPARTLTGVKAMAAGDYNGVAIMLDGSVKTWGYNFYAEVGNGENDQSGGCECVPMPTTIPAYAGAQTVSADYYSTLASFPDGSVRGNGYNVYGEVGDGTAFERTAPVGTVGVAGASVVSARAYGGAAIIGPTQTLSVSRAGAGSGTVQGGGEIGCPELCSGKYPQGKVVVLTATATKGGFAGFSGPCTGTAPCQAKMEADETVTATFGAPKGTKILKAKIQSPKKKATFKFTAPGAITGYQCLLIKPKAKKAKASKGAKKPRFSKCRGPKSYKHLQPGKYTFKVRALDSIGADAKPAKRVFQIRAKKREH
jgi:alpha-tubulin suppressor-like RCC1 family protein